MPYPKSRNIYENKKCVRCDEPAIGNVRDQYGSRYYCESHFRAYKYATDKEQDKRELAQWGDQDWYREAMGLPTSQQQTLL